VTTTPTIPAEAGIQTKSASAVYQIHLCSSLNKEDEVFVITELGFLVLFCANSLLDSSLRWNDGFL
jgi:hypothetical protein